MAVFDPTKRRDRAVLAVIGAFSGALGAFGMSIALTQNGSIEPGFALGWPVIGVVAGAIIGWANPSQRTARAVWVLIVAVVAVSAFLSASSVSAQSACSVMVTVDGRSSDLGTTSEDDPLRIDLGGEPQIEIVARAEGVELGVVEIAARSVSPGLIIDLDDSVLYYDVVEDEASTATLRVRMSGPTGFTLIGPDFETPLVPLGVTGLDIAVRDLTASPATTVCSDVAWVRFVARPTTNPLGQIALSMGALGVAGLVAVGPLRERLRLVPKPTPVVRLGDLECLFRTARGRSVDVASGLLVGREYLFQVRLHPSVQSRDADDESRLSVSVAGSSNSVRVAPSLGVGVGPFALTHDFNIVPTKKGRVEIEIVVDVDGEVVEREQMTIELVGAYGDQPDDGDATEASGEEPDGSLVVDGGSSGDEREAPSRGGS